MRLRYTLPALADLSAILDYIAVHSPQGARRVQARIQALTDLLLQHPHMGRRTSDPASRRMTTTPYPYLVFYEITSPRSLSTPSVTQTATRPECPALLERVMTEPFYAPHQLAELQEGCYAVNRTYGQSPGEYLSLRLTNEAAYEYARHGFVRKLGTLKHRAADDHGAGGLADVEREAIRIRTGERCSRAQKRGQHMGWPPKLTPVQKGEARRRRAQGATLAELARSYDVGKSTISRLGS